VPYIIKLEKILKDLKNNYSKTKMSQIEKIEKNQKSAGNTKQQISQSKYWCFTYHKGDIEKLEKDFQRFDLEFYIASQEFGGSGKTPHIQGYIEASKEIRPSELKLDKIIHWEKRKHPRKNNIIYIMKENPKVWITNKKSIVTKVLKDNELLKYKNQIKVLDEGSLYDWEKEIISIVSEDPCERTIYWYWSENGNIGKSTFTKFLAIKYNAIVISGNANDMKYAILEYSKKNKKYPDIIVCDIARNTSINRLCYSGFEEIKNGCFFSGKYESGMVLGNCPHFICFANREPAYERMSKDRWNVTKID
jgi:hypothetical protein